MSGISNYGRARGLLLTSFCLSALFFMRKPQGKMAVVRRRRRAFAYHRSATILSLDFLASETMGYTFVFFMASQLQIFLL